MTYRDIIVTFDRNFANSYDEETKFSWLRLLDEELCDLHEADDVSVDDEVAIEDALALYGYQLLASYHMACGDYEKYRLLKEDFLEEKVRVLARRIKKQRPPKRSLKLGVENEYQN